MLLGERFPSVAIDIDNTLIDTAIRKRALLKSKFNLEVSLDAIRKDFHLKKILGENNALSNNFFTLLDSEEALKHEAPVFSGALDVLTWLREKGIHIIFLSGRPDRILDATIAELTGLGLYKEGDDVYLTPMTSTEYCEVQNQAHEYKKKKLIEITSKFKVLAIIGDRLEDADSAHHSNIPAILFASTLSTPKLESTKRLRSVSIEICNSWTAIAASFEQIRLGTIQMEKLREIFTAQYSSWLRDIDEKIKAVISMSAIVSAISGNQLLSTKKFDEEFGILLAALSFSMLAVIFCIRGITSRRTSGSFASVVIGRHARQAIAILFGGPKHWLYRKGDAIDTYSELTTLSPKEQAYAHMKFFYAEYKTFNPEALLNLRMLELRSTNYSKAYAERIASTMLLISLCILFIWLITHAFNIIQ